MPTRYFQQPAGPLSILQFLAGYGQANRQTQIANAQQRSQQNQLLGAGLGKGVGNFFQVQAQDVLDRRTSEREMQMRSALQRGALENALAVEELRTQGDVYQQASRDFQRQWGTSHRAVLQQAAGGGLQPPELRAAPEPVSFGDTTGEFGASLPEQGVSQQFPQAPPPSPGKRLPPIDPASTGTYKDAKAQVLMWSQALETGRQELALKERQPPSVLVDADIRRLKEEIGMASRAVVSGSETLQRFQEPPPPRTEAELIAAGPYNGGFSVLSDGTRFSVDSTGKQHFDKSTKAAENPWFKIQSQQDFDQYKQKHVPDWAAIEAAGGKVYFDRDGDPKIWEPPSTKGEVSLDAEIAKIQKDFAIKETNKQGEATGVVLPADPGTVRKILEQRDEIKREQELKPAHDALMKRAAELSGFDNRDELTLPMIDQWVQTLIAIYGDVNPQALPDDVRRQLERWTREASRLRRYALTVE